MNMITEIKKIFGKRRLIKKRERIFRAWDKFQKIMIGVEYNQENVGILPSCDETGTSMYYSNGNITLINLSSASYDIMEFIGKKDKNLKNVYEFDIVKWKERIDDKFEPDKRKDDILGIVTWNDDICGFIVEQLTNGKLVGEMEHNTLEYCTSFYSTDGQEFLWEDLEVVGNIYQNHELLVNTEEEKEKDEH